MRILIIEDQKKLAASLKEGLEQKGFAADYVLDGESGQRRVELKRSDYDALILDIGLPKRDGITVCKNLRKENIVIPILMLTARDTVENKILGLDSGADDYLIKPFSFDELVARLRALLRRPQHSLPVELKVRDLTLNTATRKIFRGKFPITLTLKEFAILEHFMRHPGQVISREQILQHAWDFAFDSFSNVVDVHMTNLRKKIDNPHHEKLFKTIRGLGYQLSI
jgi:DNA-binding response OmpR family regulator